MALYGVIGAGGFGRGVMPLLSAKQLKENASDDLQCVFVVEDNYIIKEKQINGYKVVHLSDFLGSGSTHIFYNVAIADSTERERISSSIPSNVAQPFSIIADTHINLGNNDIGEGAICCSYTQITSNAKVGKFFHCNIYSYVEHDCVIGDFVTFAPGVKCNGHVVIEDHAYLGAGAIIKDGTQKPIRIGKGAVVGMGAVVTKSVPPGVTVVGNPARPLRK